jgi:hypothetical protein
VIELDQDVGALDPVVEERVRPDAPEPGEVM